MIPGWRHRPRSNTWRLKNAAGEVIAIVERRGAADFAVTVAVVVANLFESTRTGTIALAKAWAVEKTRALL